MTTVGSGGEVTLLDGYALDDDQIWRGGDGACGGHARRGAGGDFRGAGRRRRDGFAMAPIEVAQGSAVA